VLDSNGRVFYFTMVDFSAEGMLCRMEQPLPLKAPVTLTVGIRTENVMPEELTLKGEVRHLKPEADGSYAVGIFVFGGQSTQNQERLDAIYLVKYFESKF